MSTATLLAGMLPLFSCGSHPLNSTTPQYTQATAAQGSQNGIVPYIPPMYYACSETTPANLARVYYLHYFNSAEAENNFNGQVFVFKDITITESALKYSTDDYIWVDSIIQCYFLTSGSEKILKSGETVDMVGIDMGKGKDYAGTSGLAVPFY